ncbi:MAG: FAD/NAD(P)-binding protein [Desulfurivibrio sp.]|nr:FAD/NAD(P)-binding protein [Desulfurivibrio sp.]
MPDAAAVGYEAMAPTPWRIASVHREMASGEVFSWQLRPEESTVPALLPGQFNMLYLFGVGESAISISGIPAAADGVIHTIRAVGSVTRAMQTLTTGDIVGVRGPFGTPWPVAAARGRDLILVAGGIGLAPLRPVLHAVMAERSAFGRVLLCYGARSPGDIIFREEMAQWEAADIEVRLTVDRGTDAWQGEVGVVTNLIDRGGFSGRNAVAMVCGPEVMMHFSVLSLRRRGVDENHIYLSMERSMRCAVGFCGHCQLGPDFVCRDGPVFPYPRVEPAFRVREL